MDTMDGIGVFALRPVDHDGGAESRIAAAFPTRLLHHALETGKKNQAILHLTAAWNRIESSAAPKTAALRVERNRITAATGRVPARFWPLPR